MPNYNPAAVEPRWQQYWLANRTFRCPDPDELADPDAPKLYVLDMFPYPSGAGLHVGHPEGYTATDILARFRRMCGWTVLHPMGWDAFGLPAEQYAIKTGTHPRITTHQNIATFRRQIQALGFSYDWDREVDTTDPEYVRWTQWIFLLIHDTWYDTEAKKGRPIAELPIPPDIAARGENAVRRYQDSQRLAYQAEVPVNWCADLGTVLANEEVVDGRSEVGGYPVVRMPLRQWLLRITAYADRLIDDLEPLNWSESIKKMQRGWIGRSEGAQIRFAVGEHTLEVYTTRPDTLFGATYMVVSPEHALLATIATPAQAAAVKAYQEAASRKSEFERTEVAKVKTGVFTGAYAINPIDGEKIPVWIADYVLAGYGTGAIMAVPAHDERDFEFARAFGLPMRTVVTPSAEWLAKTKSSPDDLREAYTDDGLSCNSGEFSGLTTEEAKARVSAWLESKGIGEKRINFKLRDWLFSRQRYWGEPFPLLHEVDAAGNPTGLTRRLEPADLPLRLPDMEDFKPTGLPGGPLVKATDWVDVTIDGKRYRRETNTMPQWAGSCWYYLRYLDPKNETAMCDPAKAKFWLPVDLYVGGAEHAVLHLLYSRFWHKVLFDRGYVPSPEPFQRLINQGMILGETEYTAFKRENGDYISAKEVSFSGDFENATTLEKIPAKVLCETLDETQVEKVGDGFTVKGMPKVRIDARSFKMSKSRGNVINPDVVIQEYGADSLRLYEMFMGPLEATKPWNMRGVEGVSRFLNRVWRLIVDDDTVENRLLDSVQDVEPDTETLKLLHRTIFKLTEFAETMKFNTAIASMMEFSNHLTGKLTIRPKSVLETFVLLLAPYAPHICEELWEALGHTTTLAYEPWPKYDAKYLKDDEIEIPVQVNGKIKARLMVPAEIDGPALEALARADAKVIEAIGGKAIKKLVVVPKKMVNIVVV